MKKLILSLLLGLFMGTAMAQSPATIIPHQQLQEVFSSEEIGNMSAEQVAYYNALIQHGYMIDEYPAEKMDGINELQVLTLKGAFANTSQDYSEEGLQNFNILKYEFKLIPNHINIYRLGNTSKIVVFSSGDDIEVVKQQIINGN